MININVLEFKYYYLIIVVIVTIVIIINLFLLLLPLVRILAFQKVHGVERNYLLSSNFEHITVFVSINSGLPWLSLFTITVSLL